MNDVGYISYINHMSDFLNPGRAKIALLWFDKLLIGGPLRKSSETLVDFFRKEEPFSDVTRAAILRCFRAADKDSWQASQEIFKPWESAPQDIKDLTHREILKSQPGQKEIGSTTSNTVPTSSTRSLFGKRTTTIWCIWAIVSRIGSYNPLSRHTVRDATIPN